MGVREGVIHDSVFGILAVNADDQLCQYLGKLFLSDFFFAFFCEVESVDLMKNRIVISIYFVSPVGLSSRERL